MCTDTPPNVVLFQFHDGQKLLLGSDEWEWSPWQNQSQRPERIWSQRNGAKWEQHTSCQCERKLVSSKGQESQAEVGGEAL